MVFLPERRLAIGYLGANDDSYIEVGGVGGFGQVATLQCLNRYRLYWLPLHLLEEPKRGAAAAGGRTSRCSRTQRAFPSAPELRFIWIQPSHIKASLERVIDG